MLLLISTFFGWAIVRRCRRDKNVPTNNDIAPTRNDAHSPMPGLTYNDGMQDLPAMMDSAMYDVKILNGDPACVVVRIFNGPVVN